MAVRNLILYSYWRSSCSWRIRSVLEYKKLKYELRTVSLKEGEQTKDDFRKVNPFELVPTLVVETSDGQSITISESMAIVDYLENAFPDTPSVYPKDPVARARVMTVVQTIVSNIQPLQNISVMQMIAKTTNKPFHEWGNYWITNKFVQLEKFLQTHSGKFTVGDQFSLADICLVPQVYNAMRYKVEMDKFPILSGLNKSLLSDQDGVIYKTRPEGQPDAFEAGP